MAIRSLVTRGYGNGTFSGSVAGVVTRGYILGVPSFIAAIGRLTLHASLIGDGNRLLEVSGSLTLSAHLSALIFEGPQINLKGQFQPEIDLKGST